MKNIWPGSQEAHPTPTSKLWISSFLILNMMTDSVVDMWGRVYVQPGCITKAWTCCNREDFDDRFCLDPRRDSDLSRKALICEGLARIPSWDWFLQLNIATIIFIIICAWCSHSSKCMLSGVEEKSSMVLVWTTEKLFPGPGEHTEGQVLWAWLINPFIHSFIPYTFLFNSSPLSMHEKIPVQKLGGQNQDLSK